VETLQGSLTIYLTTQDDQNNVVYEAKDIQTSDFTFTIDDPDDGMILL
jgi:hypothetical protein